MSHALSPWVLLCLGQHAQPDGNKLGQEVQDDLILSLNKRGQGEGSQLAMFGRADVIVQVYPFPDDQCEKLLPRSRGALRCRLDELLESIFARQYQTG